MIHHLGVPGERGLDRHLLDRDRVPHQGRALWRETAHVHGLEALAAGDHGDLDAGVALEVLDEAGVRHVPVELEELAAHPRVDDRRRVLVSAREVQGLRVLELPRDVLLPSLLAPEVALQNVALVAGVPAGAVRAVLLDQVGALAEPPVVLRVVPAGLGDVIVQVQEHLVAHLLLVIDLLVGLDRLADRRVGVLSVPLVL